MHTSISTGHHPEFQALSLHFTLIVKSACETVPLSVGGKIVSHVFVEKVTAFPRDNTHQVHNMHSTRTVTVELVPFVFYMTCFDMANKISS